MSPRKRSILVYLAGAGALVVTVLGVLGLGVRRHERTRNEADARETEVRRGPRIRTAVVKRSTGVRHLTLEGEARPFFEVTLYAKVAGFLSDIKVDKGDQVRKNQLIATVKAPEFDQQFDAALADAKNKRINARRLAALAPAGVVSAQELELGQATADVADATQAALATQRGYRVIRAPFDGVVTARFADPGTLIQNAANAQSGAVPIVAVAKGDELRVYVYVDQSAAPFVRTGDRAVVRVPERPGWSRQGQVTRTSGELSPKTRTMQTEVDIPNADGAILPGSYVDVTLDVKVPALVEMPAEALVMRGEKAESGVIDAERHVHYKPLVIADDDGKTVRVVDGVKEGDRVALNLGADAQDGSLVQLADDAKPAGAPGIATATGPAPTGPPVNSR
jgi:membrane fusion protein, multidrug efflux system